MGRAEQLTSEIIDMKSSIAMVRSWPASTVNQKIVDNYKALIKQSNDLINIYKGEMKDED